LGKQQLVQAAYKEQQKIGGGGILFLGKSGKFEFNGGGGLLGEN
jgi:hypothetical protein